MTVAIWMNFLEEVKYYWAEVIGFRLVENNRRDKDLLEMGLIDNILDID